MNKVYVLTIENGDGNVYTSMYSSLTKAIKSVKDHYHTNGIEDLFEINNVKDELKKKMFNDDGINTYHIECCQVW